MCYYKPLRWIALGFVSTSRSDGRLSVYLLDLHVGLFKCSLPCKLGELHGLSTQSQSRLLSASHDRVRQLLGVGYVATVLLNVLHAAGTPIA